MALAFKIIEVYNKINYELADPRTNDLFLTSSPFKVLGILGLYLWFCLKAGPHFMKDRKPFMLKNTLLIYNAFQIWLSLIFLIKCIPYWVFTYSFICEPVDYSFSADAVHVASMIHLYFLSKIVELLDTVFFVLRKKYNQVSTLHLYHHTVMVMMTWGVTKYAPGGQSSFLGFINSFVHIIMYFYYFVASLGPQYQKHLKWKKYITIIQLVQFVILFIHALPRECEFPKVLMWMQLLQAVTFIYMFSSFYVRTYTKISKCAKENDSID